MTRSSRATEFVRGPVPPGPGKEFDVWVADCKALGETGIEGLMAVLRRGRESEAYSAVICLRQLGCGAWGHDGDRGLFYSVHLPTGDEQVIHPDRDERDPSDLVTRDYS